MGNIVEIKNFLFRLKEVGVGGEGMEEGDILLKRRRGKRDGERRGEGERRVSLVGEKGEKEEREKRGNLLLDFSWA